MDSLPPTIQCPNCGATRPAGIPVCSNCGHGKGRMAKACPKCQNPIEPGANNCWKCGNTNLQRSPSFTLWLVLFIVLGVPAGCLGGCFLLMGSESTGPTPFLMGLIGAAAFVGFLVMLIRSSKSR